MYMAALSPAANVMIDTMHHINPNYSTYRRVGSRKRDDRPTDRRLSQHLLFHCRSGSSTINLHEWSIVHSGYSTYYSEEGLDDKENEIQGDDHQNGELALHQAT